MAIPKGEPRKVIVADPIHTALVYSPATNAST
jgi:hypothetical protein